MKICPYCNAQLDDEAQFCRNCGAIQPDAEELFQTQQTYEDPFDHTKEYEEKDISEHKLLAMVSYLLGPVGVIISLLAGKDSPYAMFHVRQSLKFTVADTLLAFLALVLCWTVIVPIAAGICVAALLVVRVICFVQVCKGRAVEPAIIRSVGFLK